MNTEKMSINERLKSLKQQHQELLSLMSDKEVDEVLSDATDAEKKEIRELASILHMNIATVREFLYGKLHEDEGALQVNVNVDPELLRYYHEKIEPENKLDEILENIDDILKKTSTDDFFDNLICLYLTGSEIDATRRKSMIFSSHDDPDKGPFFGEYPLFGFLESGIRRMWNRVDENGMSIWEGEIGFEPNTGEDYDYEFRPHHMGLHDYKQLLDTVETFLYSDIIKFEPDNWMKNSKLLRAIMVGRKSHLPADIKSRLLEVFRSFIFENWLSVIALSRSTLEYALVSAWRKEWGTQPRDEKGDLNLRDLIQVARRHDPALGNLMDFIRKEGNKALHRKEKAKIWKELEQVWSPNKQDEAKDCIEKLIRVMEMIYLPRGTAKSTSKPPASGS